jgi:hypothetical protein
MCTGIAEHRGEALFDEAAAAADLAHRDAA